MQNIFTKAAPVKGARDVFAICDLPGLADLASAVPADQENRRSCERGDRWYGGKSYSTSLEQVRSGDLSGVPASDELMSKIEADAFVSPVWRNRLDVVGGAPCVPAYLAGHPMNMRRRERVLSEQGPLAIFVSMELSAGIDISTMRKRGAAMLALVRLLSNARPVELYTCVSLGEHGFGSHVLTRLDTAPLDLARAAHVMTDPSVTRGLGYASCCHIAKQQLDLNWCGNWAYGDAEKYRKTARDNFMAATGTASDALLVPGAHLKDKCVTDPTAWLKDMLAQYGGAQTAED